MTQKVAMTFIRGWGVYNAGEIAGFDADQAQALENAGIAAKAKDQPKAQTSIGSLTFDFANSPEFHLARKAIEVAGAEVEARLAEVELREAAADDRETELVKRAVDLDARDAALTAREVALATGITDAPPAGEVIDADGVVIEQTEPVPVAKATGLPKQGR